MSPEEIQQFVNSRQWYHCIDLGNGIVTPGDWVFEQFWQMIRETLQKVNFKDKIVLDMASFDGMWAFAAEKAGAKTVVATDCCYSQYQNFLFCKQVLESKVIPYYNVSPYHLHDRLDVFLQETMSLDQQPYERLFDIVQHFGLLYHLRDPMLSLSQARSVMKTGGRLILETQVINDPESKMIFNGVPPEEERWPACGMPHWAPPEGEEVAPSARIGGDLTIWWCPTTKCVMEMLKASLFEPIESTFQYLKAGAPREYEIGRMCVVAKAVDFNSMEPNYAQELQRTYRNPGLDLHPSPILFL